MRPLSFVLGVQHRQLPDGEFDHSSVITLLDAPGRILAQTKQRRAKPEPEFMQALNKLLSSSTN